MPREINLPQWGMAMNDGTVVKWLKTQGDQINKGDELVEIESTKVNAAVEAPTDGILGRIDVEEGKLVPVGTVLGMILLDGEDLSDIEKKETLPQIKKEENPQKIKINSSNNKSVASPRARNLAKKLDVDIANVVGTGPSGRITEDDVKKASESGHSESSNSDSSLILSESLMNNNVRQIIAERMYSSASNPQVTLNSKACVDNLLLYQKNFH